MRIRLTENIPSDGARQFPYLRVEKLVGQFPANPSPTESASLELWVRPYRLVQDDDDQIVVPLLSVCRKIAIANIDLTALPPVPLTTIAAELIASHVDEWASAEVVDA
jgi:hypothetical protein